MQVQWNKNDRIINQYKENNEMIKKSTNECSFLL